MHTASKTAGIITALAAGLLATGCANTTDPSARTATSTDPTASVPAWYAAGGATLTTKLGADLTAISADATGADLHAMQTHCGTLTTDIGAATNYPPIPDTQAQQHWDAALDGLTAGARDCAAGAKTGDTNLLGKSSGEIRAAGTEMAKVTARVNALANPA